MIFEASHCEIEDDFMLHTKIGLRRLIRLNFKKDDKTLKEQGYIANKEKAILFDDFLLKEYSKKGHIIHITWKKAPKKLLILQ